MNIHRTSVAVATVLSATVVLTSASIALARHGTVSHRARTAIQSQTWVSSFSNPHWEYFPWCTCWSQVGDIAYDSYGVNPVNLNNSPMKLSPPVQVAPGKGLYPTSISYDVYGKTTLAEVNVYALSTDGRSGKLVQNLTAPASANGATLAVVIGSDGTTAEQAVTFTHNRQPISSSPASTFPITDGVDFVAKRHSMTCSNGFVSPPVITSSIVADNNNKQFIPGRPTLMPCRSSYPNSIKISK